MNKIFLFAIIIVVISGGFFFRNDVQNFFAVSKSTTDSKINVTYPKPNDTITSPLIITGEARGTWYFEASAPVTLLDEKGNVIAQKYIEAQEDWMTKNFVPFKGELIFEKQKPGSKGKLVLHKDNPSGLPEHDASIEIPIRFE
jgi:hypothetical protein